MSKILIVLSTRTLEAQKVDDRLRDRIKEYDVVVCGDDPGPHWWTIDFCHELKKTLYMWCWRGTRRGIVILRQPGYPDIEYPVDKHKTPKQRDQAMIEWVKGLSGFESHLVVFVLKSSRSRKADLKEAHSHGIHATVYEI